MFYVNTELRQFFLVTGMVLEQHKDLVSSLVKAGHELALYGYNHRTWEGESIESQPLLYRARV
jgi:peptidoglycan/xylan/chitin deacetylase (PgdA/CDA1 family)